ncbi:MAG: hypothetical protein HYZ44_16930 [Bacteroidetes bacterium]|nr:hypothetical protein [Bacteroidota bacterium]
MDKKYEGFWADTWWTYEFNRDGQFIFRSEGHYGNVVDSGFYVIKDSLMFLNPTTDWPVFHDVLKTKLRIIDSNCLRDFNSNYYCTSVVTINQLNEKEWAFQDNVIFILDNLQIVKDKKESISSKYPKTEDLGFRIIYSGILIIDHKEFYKFDLSMYDLTHGPLICLSFLATKEPFDIFEYENGYENKFSSVLMRAD